MYDYRDRIKALQNLMTKNRIDYYLILLSDDHNSEYFDDYYNSIKYFTGFSGSNATLLITRDGAFMWTDGRYFIQAENELKDTGVTLMKMGLKDTPTLTSFLNNNMSDDSTLCFDARFVSVSDYERLNEKLLKAKPSRHLFDADLISHIWNDRKEPARHDIWFLPDKYSGESFESKLLRVRGDDNYKKADALVVTDLCDIAWLLNLRGSDIANMPVFYAFLIITNKSVILYTDLSKLGDNLSYVNENNITVKPYDDIYSNLSEKAFFQSNGIYKTLIDDRTCNTALYTLLNEHTTVLKARCVIGDLKCIKNDTEINNIRNAHIKDAVAVTKFLYFLDKTFNEGEDVLDEILDNPPVEKADHSKNRYYTELKLSKILHSLRSEQEDFLDESFTTISAWAEHGAIVHYEPTEESDKTIGNGNFLLVDSGGHYMDGTTDITRTFLIGEGSLRQQFHYTIVLKSHINLAKAVFLNGTSGKSLDMLARDVMWRNGYDFMHGTGHGVGNLLSVHEGPNNISIRSREEVAIKPGMITTDEPGIYLNGEYGIRLENELLCFDHSVGEYGDYYSFESLTLVPFQLKCIDKYMLNDDEKKYLNSYHKKVYDKISPFLSDSEKEWLYKATRPID